MDIVADGPRPAWPHRSSNTGASGSMLFQVTLPVRAPGVLTGHQAAVFNSQEVVSFSNSVEIEILN